MFLNKEDLLKAKVLEGRYKIEDYFPEYATYQLSGGGESIHSIVLMLYMYWFTNDKH